MAKYSNTVEYNIRTTLDKNGLIQLQTQILQVENHLKTLQSQQLISPTSASKAINTIKEIQVALNQAFNPKLGMLDNKALISNLNNIKGGINGVYQAFATGGSKGIHAFSQFYGQLTQVDRGLKQISSTSDKIFNTLGNTVRWGLIASAFASVMNAAHQSAQYVSDLDKSLTNIMMVSGETRDNMNEFAKQANQVAQVLGGTTVQMTEATKVFIQQGYGLEEASQLGSYAVHLANVSEQDSSMASDEITAYMNAFKIPLDDMGNAISKWAAVANHAAVSVEELSVASQKAASVAATVGVDLDQFAGHIAAIESVTREAPENIGNGLKTIYSRIADISLGETLEDGVNLGSFAKALEKVNVDVLDNTGKLRDAGTILEDLMQVWQELDTTQRAAVAKTVAGRFQLARFEALMNRADIYENAANISRAETGTETYDRMQETYRESLEGKSNALTAAIEEIFLNAFETDSFYGLIDAATLLAKTFGDLIEAVGGGGSAITAFTAILTKVFSTNIGRGLGNFIYNRQQESVYKNSREAATTFAKQQIAGTGLTGATPQVQSAVTDISGMVQYRSVMDAETEQRVNGLIKERLELLGIEAEQRSQIEAQLMAIAIIAEKPIPTLEAALEYLQEMVGTDGELITAESLRAVGLGKITTQLEEQQKIGAQNTRILQGMQNANITSVSGKGSTVAVAAKNFLEMGKNIQWTEAQSKRLASSLAIITEASEGKNVVLQELIEAYEIYNAELQEARMNLLALTEEANISAGSMERQEGVLMRTGVAINANSRAMSGEEERLAAQSTGTSIMNLTSGIMSLSFAWQSFQSLGSLWAEEDTDIGEKLGQTFLNLTMYLPMLIMGFSQLKTGVENLDWNKQITNLNNYSLKAKEAGLSNTLLATSNTQVAGTATKSRIGTLAAATGNSILAASARGAAVAVGVLNKAMTFMAGPWGIAITMGLMAVSAAISFLSQQSEQAYNQAKENAENAVSNYNSISDKVTSFDDLYEKYKETGNASDELINTSKELVDTLDIEGGATLVTAGRFDLLAEAITKADEAHRKMAERDIESFLAGSNAESLQGSTFGIINGSIYEDLIKSMGGRTQYDQDGKEITSASRGVSEVEKAKINNSPAEAIAAAKKTIQQYNDEVDDLEAQIKAKQGNNEDTTQLEDFKKQKLAQIQKINEALNIEDIADYISNLQSLAELKTQDIANQITDDATLEEIEEIFKSDEYINEYLTSLGNWSDQLAWMISQTSNETAKLTLILNQSQNSFKEQMQNKISSSLEANGISSANLGIANQDLYSQQMTEQMLSQISNSGLTNREQIQFIASIDWNQSLDNIQQQINEIQNSGQLPKLAFETEMTDRSDFSDEKTADILEEADMSEASLNRMSMDIFDSDAMQASAEKVKKSIRSVQDQIDSGSISAEDGAKQIKKLRQRYEDLGDTAKDIATYNTQMNNGVSKLVKNWETLGEVLQTDAAKGTADYYDALGDLDEIMSEILNIDVGVLSQDFYQNADALDAMQRASEGDVSAIDDLRRLAAEDIILHLDIDNISEEDYNTLINEELLPMMYDLQSYIDSIPLDMQVGANLDDQPFIAKLNELLANSQITAEQASIILSSMGIDANIRTVSTTVTQQHQAAFPVYQEVEEGGVKQVKPVGVETLTYSSDDQLTYPVIEGAAYTGSGIQTVGASSAGNTGGSSGGSGGSGGSSNKSKSVSKSADIDETKPAEAENDIYEKVNATLEKLQDNYSKLNKVKERTWGKEYRDNAQKGLNLLVQEQKTLDKRIDIAKKYADALKTGKSNLAYGIDMTGKESLASLGLTDADADGVIDNYISKFEEARQAARKLDAEAEEYRKKANAEALAYWKSKGGRLDAEGNVVTEATMSESESEYYSQLVEKQKTHYENLVEKANKQWEIAENINDVTKDYEDTMNQIRDDEEEQLDLMHEIEDIQIDLYQRSLDMLDTLHDINDIAAKMKGFFTGLASDDPFRALTEGAQAFEDSFKDADYNATEYYNDIISKLKEEQKQVKASGGDWKQYNEAIKWYNQQKKNALTNADGLGSGELAQESRKLAELDRWMRNPNLVDNPYGTNTEALYDAYKEQYQKVTDAALEAEERMEAVHKSIIEAYDKIAEEQEELADKYDRIDDQLNRTADRVSLYKGEDAYADQATIAKERAKVALEAGKSSLKALDKYRTQLAKAEEQQEAGRADRVAAAAKEVDRLQRALNADKNNLDLQQQLATAKVVLEQAKYDDTEEVKWLKNQIDETTDYINDKADEAAEHFKDAYENTIDELAAQTNDKIFGNRDLDLITNDWGWDKDYFDTYKDNVERTLETEKLRLKYLDLLDSAQGSSLGIQRQIKDAMDEQLALLENQKTMSEYDVKLANARLEILQKQIALENAQQNKNQMKLRRDSQGNYKYVYAADQDDIRGKQRELLESEFDAYEMSKDANGDAYQQGIALYQQYIEQRTAIEKKYANDVDTMEKELAKLRENYLRAAEANAEDLQNTYDGMIISVQWMAEHGTEAVQQMTEDVLDALEEKTQESLEAVGIPWNEALANGISDLENLQQTIDETAQAGIDAAKEFVDAIDGNEDSVVNLVNAANESMQESFGDTVVAINEAEDATKDLATATSNLNSIMGEELGAIDQAKQKIIEYEKQLAAAKESTSALAGQLATTKAQLADKTREANAWKVTYENYKQSIEDEKAAAKKKEEEDKKKAEEAKKKKEGTGSNNGGYSDSEIAWGIAQNIWTYGSWGNDPDRHSRIAGRYGEKIANLTQQYINEYWATGQLVNLDSKKWGYATGGYTGTWGKGSGLDGENGKLAFLHQKELVLNQQDTENILEAVQVMRSMMDITKLASLSSSGFDVKRISQTATDTIEQRVEIVAEFPAANSADDIRQALLGLSDSAMQYAYRER